MKKVIIAFSGGLDTSYCVVYLKEQGYDVVTATINTGGFDKEQLAEIEKKALKLGSSKHYNIGAEDKIYAQIVQYIIKLNALYGGDYPLMCADRYIIAQEVLDIAKKENTNIVCHGSTSIGNDQVRFDSAFYTLKEGIQVLCPIKAMNLTRNEEIAFLESRGHTVKKESKKYSINQNVFGVTVSGSEIDKHKEPSEDAYVLTKKTVGTDANVGAKKSVLTALAKTLTPSTLTLEFKEGLPIALNGKNMDGLSILKYLNLEVGKYGYGSVIYTGDCIIGIKGRIMFEAPGLLSLIDAHKKLEQMTLTKRQLRFNSHASEQWSDLVYNGLYYEPLVKNIEAYADSVQKKVSGIVTLKLKENSVSVVAIDSRYALFDESIATYAQKGSWDAKSADGFIKMHIMQQNIAWKKSGK